MAVDADSFFVLAGRNPPSPVFHHSWRRETQYAAYLDVPCADLLGVVGKYVHGKAHERTGLSQ